MNNYEEYIVLQQLQSYIEQGDVSDFTSLLTKNRELVNERFPENNETLFHIAALNAGIKNSRIQIMKALFDNGADVNLSDSDNQTALDIAALKGDELAVELLIGAGADIDSKGEDETNAEKLGSRRSRLHAEQLGLRRTPLHCAVASGNLNVVRMLVSKGADVNAGNENKGTPLHIATVYGHIDIMNYLIEHGANVNAKNDCGETALHIAAIKNNMHAVMKLLAHRADYTIKNPSGQTCFDIIDSEFGIIGSKLNTAKRVNKEMRSTVKIATFFMLMSTCGMTIATFLYAQLMMRMEKGLDNSKILIATVATIAISLLFGSTSIVLNLKSLEKKTDQTTKNVSKVKVTAVRTGTLNGSKLTK